MTVTDAFRDERARGTTIGATIMGGFGAVWLVLGMASEGISTRAAVVAVLPVAVLIAFLGSTVRRRLPKPADVESPKKKQMMRYFSVVNVVQWLAIFGTIRLLRNLHLDVWTVPAIVLIVGAHFLPLARIFEARQHWITGVALMLCAAAAIVLPVSVRDTVECVSAGLILWASAASSLYAGFRMTTRSAFVSHGSVAK